MYVDAVDESLTISYSRRRAVRLRWDEIGYIEKSSSDPGAGREYLVGVETRDGRHVGIPDALYPDARGDFASKRHTRRVDAIVGDLRKHLAQFGLQC